jgi:hypothetical protein
LYYAEGVRRSPLPTQWWQFDAPDVRKLRVIGRTALPSFSHAAASHCHESDRLADSVLPGQRPRSADAGLVIGGAGILHVFLTRFATAAARSCGASPDASAEPVQGETWPGIW